MSDQDQNQNQPELPEYARGSNLQEIFWNGSPKVYSFDGSTGEFSLGSESVELLYCQIFEWRWQESERWGRGNQAWLDLAFIDTEGGVGQLSLKKDSAINVHAYLSRLTSGKLTRGTPCKEYGVWTRLEHYAETTTDHEVYYVVRASLSGIASQEQVANVELFQQSGVFQWLLVGEVD